MSGEGAERERERGRERIPSRLLAVSAEPNAELDPTNREIMMSAEIKSQMPNLLSHPGAPTTHVLFIHSFIHSFNKARTNLCTCTALC